MKKNDLSAAKIPVWMSALISEDDQSAIRRKRSSSFDAPSNSSFQTLDLPSMLRQLKTSEVTIAGTVVLIFFLVPIQVQVVHR